MELFEKLFPKKRHIEVPTVDWQDEGGPIAVLAGRGSAELGLDPDAPAKERTPIAMAYWADEFITPETKFQTDIELDKRKQLFSLGISAIREGTSIAKVAQQLGIDPDEANSALQETYDYIVKKYREKLNTELDSIIKTLREFNQK